MKALLAAVALSLAPAAYAHPRVVVAPCGPAFYARPVRRGVFVPRRFFPGRYFGFHRFARRFR
ncbi:MAG TPA: hypothetical protein VMB50_10410 [Myxococcales bacterium]|nr:hypothetical protein [Myxococcales bacterium]